MPTAKKAARKTASKSSSKPAPRAAKPAAPPAEPEAFAANAWTPVDVPPGPAWTPAPPPTYATPQPAAGGMDERQYTLLLHLSALAGLLIGGFFFLGPLILWLVKKDQSPFIDRHGRAAMDFHVSMLIYAAGAFVLFFLVAVVTLGIGAVLMLPLLFVGGAAWFVLTIIFPILAGTKANQGLEYRYPLSIRLFTRTHPSSQAWSQ